MGPCHHVGVHLGRLCSGFFAVLAAASLGAGCAAEPRDGAGEGGAASIGPGARLPGFVERVVDGDTVVANVDGVRMRVRLLGIDTPESVAPGEPAECFGPEATRRARQLLPKGAAVQIVLDPRGEVRDRFGRLLAYVERRGRMVNEQLVRSGHAEVFAYRNRQFARRSRLEATERRARRARRGLWGACAGATAGAQAGAPQSDAPPEGTPCPDDRPIKGNLPSGIYHRPGDPSYERTKPERCFASAAKAEAAGFRPPLRR